MKAILPDERKILSPFDKRECIDLRGAARTAGKSVSTMRAWCDEHGLGRRVGGGTWSVSRVALALPFRRSIERSGRSLFPALRDRIIPCAQKAGVLGNADRPGCAAKKAELGSKRVATSLLARRYLITIKDITVSPNRFYNSVSDVR
jgi:hypothetical protein